MTKRKLTWAEWKRREDEPRRQIRIALEATRRHLTHALNTSEGVDFDVAPLPGDPTTLRDLLVESLGRLRTRLDEVEAVLDRRAAR